MSAVKDEDLNWGPFSLFLLVAIALQDSYEPTTDGGLATPTHCNIFRCFSLKLFEMIVNDPWSWILEQAEKDNLSNIYHTFKSIQGMSVQPSWRKPLRRDKANSIRI